MAAQVYRTLSNFFRAPALPSFFVALYDPTGALIGSFDFCQSLYYRRQRNAVGMAIMTVADDHPILNLLTQYDLLCEIFVSYPRRDFPGSLGYWNDFLGLYTDVQVGTDRHGQQYKLLYFPSTNELLTRWIMAYAAGVAQKTSWVGSQLAHIANDIGIWNATSDATVANGRLRNITRPYNLEDGGGIGGTPVVDYRTTHRSLMEVLQEFAPLCGFDFEVIRDPFDPVDTLKIWQHAGQLGTDRTSTGPWFSLYLDNLGQASLAQNRQREKTVAIVGGPGEGTGRQFTIVNLDGTTPAYDYELFIDARNSESELERATIGQAKLEELRARKVVRASVLQTPECIYGRDYFLGDIIPVNFGGVTEPKIIDAVDVKFTEDGKYEVGITLEVAP